MSKKISIVFSVSLFIAIGVFVVLIGRMEFEDKSNVDELDRQMAKNMPKSSVLPTSPQATGSVAGAQSATNQQTSNAPQASQQSDPSLPPSQENSTAENSPSDNNDSSEKSSSSENKTFKDESMGISFDYASEYNMDNTGTQVVAAKDGKTQWKMKVYDNKNKKEIKDWFDSYFDKDNNKDCVLGDAGTLKFGSLTTKTLKADSMDKKCDDGGYFALNTDKTKVVRVVLGKADETEANKILNTFKFISKD